MLSRWAAAALLAVAHGEWIGRPYDLVLMDWSMPGMDGVECAGSLDARTERRPGAKSQDVACLAMAKLAGKKVLLVENNEINRELAPELLVREGMEVVVAEDCKRALAVLDEGAGFDGILMNCQIPVMDGYAAPREIRKRAALRDLPVLAMMANAMAGDRERALAAGMNDYIAKPLDVADMFVTLARWFADGRA